MKSTYLVLLFLSLLTGVLANEESFTLPNGQSITYLIELPESDKPAPLAIVIGGGTGDRSKAEAAMERLGKQLAKRGWIAVSPISPEGKSFFNEPEIRQIQYLINHLIKKQGVKSDKILIGGFSNGGISALAVARLQPEKFRGVIMTPGLPRLPAGANLKELPIYLRIGENDQLGWADFYDRAVTDLTKAKARLNAKLLQDAGHGFDLNFEEIDKWLAE